MLLLLILSLVIEKRGGSLGLRLLLLLCPTILLCKENSCRLLWLGIDLWLSRHRCVTIITEHHWGNRNLVFLISIASSVHAIIIGVGVACIEIVCEASGRLFLKVRLYLHLRVSKLILLILLVYLLLLWRIAAWGWVKLVLTIILESPIHTHHLWSFFLNSSSASLWLVNHLLSLYHVTREAARLLLPTLNVAILLVIVEVISKAVLLGLSKGFNCRLCLWLGGVHTCFIFIIYISCIIIIFNEIATRSDDWFFLDWLAEVLLAATISTEKRMCCTHRLFVFLNLLTLDGKVRIVIVAVIWDNLLLNFILLIRVVHVVLIEVTLSLHIVHISRWSCLILWTLNDWELLLRRLHVVLNWGSLFVLICEIVVHLILLMLFSLILSWSWLIEIIEYIAIALVFLSLMHTTILLIYWVVWLRITSTEESIGCATFHYWSYLCGLLIHVGKWVSRLHDILTLIHLLLLLLIICEVGAAVWRWWCRCKLLGLFLEDSNAYLFGLRLLILRVFASKTSIGSKVFLVILELLFLGSSAASEERWGRANLVIITITIIVIIFSLLSCLRIIFLLEHSHSNSTALLSFLLLEKSRHPGRRDLLFSLLLRRLVWLSLRRCCHWHCSKGWHSARGKSWTNFLSYCATLCHSYALSGFTNRESTERIARSSWWGFICCLAWSSLVSHLVYEFLCVFTLI